MSTKKILCIALTFFHFHSSIAKRPINLTIAKNKVQKYYETGAYDKDLERVVAHAKKRFKKIPVGKNATIIFDIDETVLFGYPDTKSISFGYIPKLSHKWILEADAPAIAQVKELYDYLVQRGFKIVFMTGRKYNEYDATIKNLKREGFTTFDKLIVRSKEEHHTPAWQYKSARRKQLVQQGYDIVGTIGDQKSDMVGGYTGYRVKLPNYIYMID